MISLQQAIDQGISVVRRNPWSPSARIELNLVTVDGCTMIGRYVTAKHEATDAGWSRPIEVLSETLNLDDQRWEPWEGIDDESL